MRSKFGTALALVAVLLTGTAAAAINTQALITPTESTLGTAATTLLPAEQAVTTIPAAPATPVQSLSASQSQDQVASSPVTQPSVAPTVSTPVTNQSATSLASASKSPSVVYRNPNPSNGDEDDDDEDDDEDEDDEDDEDEDDD